MQGRVGWSQGFGRVVQNLFGVVLVVFSRGGLGGCRVGRHWEGTGWVESGVGGVGIGWSGEREDRVWWSWVEWGGW